jgi:hypothetical protein
VNRNKKPSNKAKIFDFINAFILPYLLPDMQLLKLIWLGTLALWYG